MYILTNMEKFDQIKYQNEYNKEHYAVIRLNVKKEKREEIEKKANEKGYKKISEYILKLIETDLNENQWGGVIKKRSFIFSIYPQPRFSKILAQGQARQPKKIYPSPYMTQVRGKDSPTTDIPYNFSGAAQSGSGKIPTSVQKKTNACRESSASDAD